jgi:thymidylate synthase (FAD)
MTQVLDHGYLNVVESWGSDERIVEAARMSTNKGFLGWGPQHAVDCSSLCPCNTGPHPCNCEPKPGDEKLLRYLYENKHATPFEFAGLVIEVQAPIFVFREWHRHRVQSYNEMSARYTPLPDLNYVPTVERLMLKGGSNKQASGTGAELTLYEAELFREKLADIYRLQETIYQEALCLGVPKELARVHLPVGRYSRMRASANLRNWLAFLTLRCAPTAQWEIRQYANALAVELRKLFPRTMENHRAHNELRDWLVAEGHSGRRTAQSSAVVERGTRYGGEGVNWGSVS